MQYNAVGINHETWFTQVRVNGKDAMPKMREIARQRIAAAPEMNAPVGSVAPWVPVVSPYGNGVDPFSWQRLLTFGGFPAPLDRHVTEFFSQLFRSGAYFGKTLGVDEFSFEGTIAAGDRIFDQMQAACLVVGATIVGGHTEVTPGLSRPIVVGTLLGTVMRDRLVMPDGAQPGDAIILTKRLAVEATAIMAREKAQELSAAFDEPFLQRCRRYLRSPGISVMRDAQIATQAGHIHAMHDPTEGGVATALYEMAAAAQVEVRIDPRAVMIYPETQTLCNHFGLDPWGVIASGSLLVAVGAAEADRVVEALQSNQIEAAVIGHVVGKSDRPIVLTEFEDRCEPLRMFMQDEIAKLF
ncbi:MAG: hypothetical protein HGB05_19770 [Chloroflexi bacterium]|nr:hypothetical protein [Chloroflexota bacterium]